MFTSNGTENQASSGNKHTRLHASLCETPSTIPPQQRGQSFVFYTAALMDPVMLILTLH